MEIITSVSTELHCKKSAKKLPSDKTEADAERATTKKRYISLEERQQIIGQRNCAQCIKSTI